MMLFFGLLGLAIHWLQMPIVPLLLALVLGRPLEEHLWAALTASKGDVSGFLTSPFRVLSLCLPLVSICWSFIAVRRQQATASDT